MILKKLKAEIVDIVQDTKYESKIIGFINEACLEIAAGVMIPGKHQLTPPLPELFTSGDMPTIVDTDIAPLPTNYHRKVTQILNSNNDPMTLEESSMRLATMYPKQDAGSVFMCAIHGKNFVYRGVPATAETLTFYYYKLPTVLVDDDDEPDFLPENLQKKLIIGHVCAEIFDRIEDGVEGKKTNTKYYTDKYYAALKDLELQIGMDAAPMYHSSEGVNYCP